MGTTFFRQLIGEEFPNIFLLHRPKGDSLGNIHTGAATDADDTIYLFFPTYIDALPNLGKRRVVVAAKINEHNAF